MEGDVFIDIYKYIYIEVARLKTTFHGKNTLHPETKKFEDANCLTLQSLLLHPKMHFSSIAVSVLAQSVPLLAVGHRAGWKKREERSWVQGRRLSDALLVGIHDKKGIVLEKRVGVHVKQDDVLKTKRAGSARLAQDSASSEIPSDDREASVECDPHSKVTDSGIFGCGMDGHCVESEESELGGFCVALKLALSVNRALQQDVRCVEGPDEDGKTCDCSVFNNTSGFGTFTCIESEYCFVESPETCGIERSNTYNADGSYGSGYCFDPTDGGELVNKFCYSTTFTALGLPEECEFKVNDVVCNSCAFDQEECPANSEKILGTVFDCKNTVINKQGNTCDSIFGFLSSLDDGVPTTAPSGTEPPSASPVEELGLPTSGTVGSTMPTTESTNSSGGRLTANMTIVVSAAVTAWLASFGI
jgi:hypothetical protein